MSSRALQFRQSFLLTGALVAFGLVTAFALLSSHSATRVVERQANARGHDIASHVASLVDLYLRERHQEAGALARSPAVVRAALDASQQAVRQRLTQLDIPTLERMFIQRRELGGDADLATYLHDYREHSDFAELFFTDSHGYTVLASDRTSDFVQSDEEWWRRSVGDGAYDGPPSYDSSAGIVSLEYDVAIRAPRGRSPDSGRPRGTAPRRRAPGPRTPARARGRRAPPRRARRAGGGTAPGVGGAAAPAPPAVAPGIGPPGRPGSVA